jgi:ATP-binding cassette subfamily B protein
MMLRRSWQLDRALMAGVFLLMALENAAFAASALGVRWLVNAALSGSVRSTILAATVGGLAFATIAVAGRVQQELRLDLSDRVGMLGVDTEVQSLVAGVDGVEHLERPEYLDRVTLLRGQGALMAESSWAVLDSLSNSARVIITLILLATIHPALILLALLAIPALLLNGAGQRTIRRAALRSAEDVRVERHLFNLAVSSGAGKELRVFGAGPELNHRAGEAWRRASATLTAARWRAALMGSAGWAAFMIGFAAALGVVVVMVARGGRSIGDVVLVVTLAGTLRAQFERVAYSVSRVLIGLTAVEPYLWLREYAAARRTAAQPAAVPARLNTGISLRDVSFSYPGTPRRVLHDVSIDLPAGAMVAVVGEHGSGKSTLVKLLCKLYEPTTGQILVDGASLSTVDTVAWHGATAAAFQDFGRYEVRLREAIGLGEPRYLDDTDRITGALAKAEGTVLLDRLPDGLDTELGPGGVDLSEGQWQRVALARAAMRDAPRLFVLDEPTASLDPPTEYAVFTRQAQLAREIGAATGAVTVVVTHRFTTVRMADLILVLREGELVEVGNHRTLLAADGLYAELYRLQETAYAASEGTP